MMSRRNNLAATDRAPIRSPRLAFSGAAASAAQQGIPSRLEHRPVSLLALQSTAATRGTPVKKRKIGMGKDDANDNAGQPEALATFAATARNDGKKPAHIGLKATPDTAPLSVPVEQEIDAATKVLHEGATGENVGADEAVKAIPDRVTAHRAK
jgi:hypothetical protein